MKQREDLEIKQLLEQEYIELYNENRDELRRIAKSNIAKVTEENRKTYNRNTKPAKIYQEGDLVLIKRTQFGPGLKIKKRFLGPYKVVRVKRNNRYEVVRVSDDDEGPRITSTAADFMKPFFNVSSGTEE